MRDPQKQIKRRKDEYRPKPIVMAVYWVLRFIVIVSLVLSCIRKDYESAWVCVLVLVLYMLPRIVQQNFHIELPSALEIIILVLIFAGEILGELRSYFIYFPHWDTLLHTTSGFVSAAFGYSMTVGVIWEFFEFGMDNFFHMDMQKDTVIHAFSSVNLDPTASNIPVRVEDITDVAVNGTSLGLGGYLDIGLYDTMEDLFVNFIGALTFSVIGYFSAKSGKNSIAKNFVPVVVPEEAPESEAGQTNTAEDTTEKNTD